VVIVASLGAALGVAARPHAHIDGVDGCFFASLGERMAGEQPSESFSVDPPSNQCSIKASPAAAVRWLEAEVSRRRDGVCGKESISELEEGISPTVEALVVEGVAEGA
jgi:hypothetical protein